VIGFLSSISSLVSIFIPVISAWIIIQHGFDVLFLVVLILIAVSVVPLFLVRPTFEKFSYRFGQTWQKIFSRQHRRMCGSYFAQGIENSIGVIIWPIFIFQLLNGDFLKVGIVSSLIILVTVVLRLVIGSFTDRFDKRKVLRWEKLK